LTDLEKDFPEDQDVLTALIRAHNGLGGQEAAIRYADRLVNIQGSGGSQVDLDNLHATLQMYEQVVDDYSQDYEDVWQRNLSALASLANRPLEEMQEQEEESLLFGELPDLEEDTVPIIGVGGIDPVVAVQEDEESIILEEMEEEMEPPPEDEDADELPIAPILAAPLPVASEPARDAGGASGSDSSRSDGSPDRPSSEPKPTLPTGSPLPSPRSDPNENFANAPLPLCHRRRRQPGYPTRRPQSRMGSRAPTQVR